MATELNRFAVNLDDTVLFSIVAEDWPDVRQRRIVRLKEAGHG